MWWWERAADAGNGGMVVSDLKSEWAEKENCRERKKKGVIISHYFSILSHLSHKTYLCIVLLCVKSETWSLQILFSAVTSYCQGSVHLFVSLFSIFSLLNFCLTA
jgi:hypothetical protein